MPAPLPTRVRIAIIGSGFAGLGAAIRLRQSGETDFVVLERASEVGGVWRDNSYPGCACDVQSRLYSFSFAPKADWSRAYAPQAEILGYLRDCARRFDVLPHVRFEHEVRAARWDDDEQVWHLTTSHGTLRAEALIAGQGALADPAIPQLPGIERFDGIAFHSARWNHEVSLRGKRIAVVGTGASAIQFVPRIQPEAGKLLVFQRTPPWILPRRDAAIGAATQRLFAAVPATERAARRALFAARELTLLSFRRGPLNRLARGLAKRHLARHVPDRALRAKLTPRYDLGCKRILLSDDYLPALTRANVEVVTDAIREVNAHGIVTAADGEGPPRTHAVDVLIYGTGFRITDPPIAHIVRGRDGRSLAEVWQGSPHAHLGVSVAGFPNLFLLQGPNTGLGHSSVITMIEAQIEHTLHALAHLRQVRGRAIEPRAAAQAAFLAALDEKMNGSVWTQGGCASWYLDHTGRNSTLWPDFVFRYQQRLAHFRADEYHVSFREPANGL